LQKKNILKETKEKADLYLNDINKRVESAIKNIRESAGQKEKIKEEKKQVEEIKTSHQKFASELFEEESISQSELKEGDYVIISSTTTGGAIQSLDREKDKATILSGAFKMQVKLSDLKKSKMNERVESFNNSYHFSLQLKSYRLDLRGKKPEEAEFEIIKFLDDAYSSSVNQVEILHGKGTGALKKVVYDILKSYKGVKKYYFANIEFGGEGITIVEFN
jgi:DNA mismatch repair protein MutS2